MTHPAHENGPPLLTTLPEPLYTPRRGLLLKCCRVTIAFECIPYYRSDIVLCLYDRRPSTLPWDVCSFLLDILAYLCSLCVFSDLDTLYRRVCCPRSFMCQTSGWLNCLRHRADSITPFVLALKTVQL